MARYRVYAPVYVEDRHLAIDASMAQPREIDLPDDYPVEPSLKWDPMDEAALKNLQKAFKSHAQKIVHSLGLSPEKDKEKIAAVFAEADKAFQRKKLVKIPEAKPVPKEVNTNAEIMEQGKKIVGRLSDKSPA